VVEIFKLSISDHRVKIAALLFIVFACRNIVADEYVFGADSCNICLIASHDEASLGSTDQLPAGMQFYPDSGTLLWNPDASSIGDHHVCLTATHHGIKEKIEIDITVKEVEKILCVFAHQDDEFGIIGKIIQMEDAGKDVFLAWTRSSSQQRNNESRTAMHRIGVSDDEMSFWNFGDISTPETFLIYIEKLSALIAKHHFDQIYVVGYEGGHIEHDLTHIATVSACRRIGFRGQIYEFGLYHLDHLTPQPFSLISAPSPSIQMTLDQRSLDFMESLTDLYVSQKHITRGFRLGMSETKKSHPCYRPLPHWDYSRPPSSGVLWYEANLKHPASFRKHLLPALQSLWQIDPVVVLQSRYAQDIPKSKVGDLVLPDQKEGEVIDICFPYSVYAYSGVSLVLLFAGFVLWLPIRLWRKRIVCLGNRVR